ncbi:TIR domain-containing protein [Komagataeibacter sp. NFXK3]
MKPRMFIASSADHLDLAYATQEGLEHDVEATVWNQGVFTLSRSTMSTLLDVLDESDFGLFIFAPSDVSAIKKVEKQTVRDNVIFELGLFIGRLGAERCFIIMPRGIDDLHLPTDLLGVTTASFEPSRQDGNLVAALGPACSRIRASLKRLGLFKSAPIEAVASTSAVVESVPELVSDPNDIVALIQSWMGSRPASDNSRAIFFSDVDIRLNLVPGSAAKYIEQAAARWNYAVERRGPKTVLFRDNGPIF